MNSRHEVNATPFQVFSPYGPFKRTYANESQFTAAHELRQLQPPNLERISPSNFSNGQTSVTPTIKTQTLDHHCSFHKACFHAQRLIFGTAVLAGLALVIAGIIQKYQSTNDGHYDNLYIGVLLLAVGLLLLILQWDVQRKQKLRRKRAMGIITHPHTDDQLGQANSQPLLMNVNQVIVQPASRSHVDTSPSEFRSILSQPAHQSFNNQDIHYHIRSNQSNASQSTQHIPRYDVYSSQAISGYHDLAHSVTVQDEV